VGNSIGRISRVPVRNPLGESIRRIRVNRESNRLARAGCFPRTLELAKILSAVPDVTLRLLRCQHQVGRERDQENPWLKIVILDLVHATTAEAVFYAE